MHRSALSIITVSFGVLALAGCVTINIYFPAAAAEAAADRIIEEVWQLKPEQPKPSTELPAAR